MKLRILGVGLYREAFKVVNSDIVIKFPLARSTNEGIRHSVQEMRRIRRLRQSETLAPFLPEVFYYDKKSGVIAMKYYDEFDSFESQADAMGRMIQKLIYRISRVKCTDIHTDNVRRGRGNLNAVIIDLGF